MPPYNMHTVIGVHAQARAIELDGEAASHAQHCLRLGDALVAIQTLEIVGRTKQASSRCRSLR